MPVAKPITVKGRTSLWRYPALRYGVGSRVLAQFFCYGSFVRLNGGAAAFVALYTLLGGNALDVARQVKAQMERLAKRCPVGMAYTIVYDTTTFVQESISEVLLTLGEAILLVLLVVFIFLQNWRATLIPAITIPVSLIGTFVLMNVLGFSIDLLTLFGRVLATGLVVDERHHRGRACDPFHGRAGAAGAAGHARSDG